METKRTAVILLLAVLLGSIASAAMAKQPRLDHIRHLDRHNASGTSYAVLPSHGNRFCYLSRVGVRETDTATELSGSPPFVSEGFTVDEPDGRVSVYFTQPGETLAAMRVAAEVDVLP